MDQEDARMHERLARIEALFEGAQAEARDWRRRTDDRLDDICDDIHGDKESSMQSRLNAIDKWRWWLLGALAALMFLTGDGAVSLAKFLRVIAGQ